MSRLSEKKVSAFTPRCTLGKPAIRVALCDRDLSTKRDASQPILTPHAVCFLALASPTLAMNPVCSDTGTIVNPHVRAGA